MIYTMMHNGLDLILSYWRCEDNDELIDMEEERKIGVLVGADG